MGGRRVGLALLAGLALGATAQEPAVLGPAGEPIRLEGMVVTATRTPLRLEQVASAVTVIAGEELKRGGARDLTGLLAGLPGLELNRAGGPGGTATLSLRGAGEAHTLLLIDGVEQNDPIAPGRGADLATLALDRVERVEIVRGPQSALYGADAIGGVVQVITRAAAPGLRLDLHAGDNGQSGVAAEAGLRRGRWALALDAAHARLSGHSAAAEADGNGESDGLRAGRGGLRLDWGSAAAGLTLALRGEDSRVDLDNFGGVGGDDPNSTGRTRRLAARLEGRHADPLGPVTWQLWRQETRRDYDNPADAAHPGESLDAEYRGGLLHAGLQQGWRRGRHDWLGALEWEEEAGRSRSLSQSPYGPWSEDFPQRRERSWAVVVQDRVSLGDLALTGSLRRDRFRAFGGQATGRLTAGWRPGAGPALLRASWGTGFKAPSLYQLHSPYGNPGLEAERSHGWDAGVELRGARLAASLGFFHSELEREIDFDAAAWRYHNLGRTRSRGLEYSLRGRPAEDLSWRLDLTALDARDRDSGARLLRRARLAAGAGLRAERGPASLDLSWRYRGPREDLDFAAWPARRVILAGYALTGLRLGWRLLPSLEGWLDVENLLGRRHQEVLGYQGQPRSWRLGLAWAAGGDKEAAR